MELVDMTEKRDWTANVKSWYECESEHMMSGQLRNFRTLYKVDAPR